MNSNHIVWFPRQVAAPSGWGSYVFVRGCTPCLYFPLSFPPLPFPPLRGVEFVPAISLELEQQCRLWINLCDFMHRARRHTSQGTVSIYLSVVLASCETKAQNGTAQSSIALVCNVTRSPSLSVGCQYGTQRTSLVAVACRRYGRHQSA